VLVRADGEVRVVADDLFFPNGTVITPDGSTLIVGESFGGCLTAFDIEDDGSLSGRREWGRVMGSVPDGICLDAEGAIWMASPVSNRVLRVAEGGEVLDEVRTSDERQPFACMLGGDDGTTLFMLTADWRTSEGFPENIARLTAEPRTGRVLIARAPAPGAGWP
jgi:sugar lactone lactonase YvrE